MATGRISTRFKALDMCHAPPHHFPLLPPPPPPSPKSDSYQHYESIWIEFSNNYNVAWLYTTDRLTERQTETTTPIKRNPWLPYKNRFIGVSMWRQMALGVGGRGRYPPARPGRPRRRAAISGPAVAHPKPPPHPIHRGKVKTSPGWIAFPVMTSSVCSDSVAVHQHVTVSITRFTQLTQFTHWTPLTRFLWGFFLFQINSCHLVGDDDDIRFITAFKTTCGAIVCAWFEWWHMKRSCSATSAPWRHGPTPERLRHRHLTSQPETMSSLLPSSHQSRFRHRQNRLRLRYANFSDWSCRSLPPRFQENVWKYPPQICKSVQWIHRIFNTPKCQSSLNQINNNKMYQSPPCW